MKKKALLLVVFSTLLCGCTAKVTSSSVLNDNLSETHSSMASQSNENNFVDITVVGGTIASTHVEKGTKITLTANEPENGYFFF